MGVTSGIPTTKLKLRPRPAFAPTSLSPPTMSQQQQEQQRNATVPKNFPYPFNWRSLLSFTVIECILLLSTRIAYTMVIPTHPKLFPLTIILPAIITMSFYKTLSFQSSLFSYDNETDEIMRNDNVYEKCLNCHKLRLERTHHCKKCKRCIPRMSHHCGVLGICIGAHNLKSFLLSLFYSIVGTFIVSYVLVPQAISKMWNIIHGSRNVYWGDVIWLYSMYLQFVLCAVCTGLFLFHIRLVCVNYTILEGYIGKRLWKVITGTDRFNESMFDVGVVGNLEQVFSSGFKMLSPFIDWKHAVHTALAWGDKHQEREQVRLV